MISKKFDWFNLILLILLLNVCLIHHNLFYILFLASSVGFAVALGLGVVGFFEFLLWVVFVDCIGVGLVVATALW